jgi:hypothetical protein
LSPPRFREGKWAAFRIKDIEMKTPTATAIAKMKREARKRARASGDSYQRELEQLASARGYASWREVVRLAAATASIPRPLESLPLDPKLRPRFDDTPNEKRTAAELDTWWMRPFGRTLAEGAIEVRCLDGGAWDRSTFYGVARSLEEAQELAARKLAKWREFLDTPMSFLGEDGVSHIALQADRPGQPLVILHTLAPGESAADWLDAWNRHSPDYRRRRIVWARR